jgi:predicted amidohydrolase
MLASDYATGERFRRKLDGYLAAARERGLVGPRTVVVFPEFLGSWLVVSGEKRAAIEAKSTQKAAILIALSNLPSFVVAHGRSRAQDRMTAGVFRMKAGEMARAYQDAFSHLAKEYGVTIVAGSIVLPSPRVEDGQLVIGEGPLYNATVIYDREGRACQPAVRKAFPTAEELPFIAPGVVDDLPVFETPAGRLGVLICADSWYPEAYERLRRLKVEMIAVPSFGHTDPDEMWSGYSGFPNPADVRGPDVKHIRVGEAWRKYALPARMDSSGARVGVNVFLRGRLWDQTAKGIAFSVRGGKTEAYPSPEWGSIINVWREE